MDEDDNISNADISMDDDDENEPNQQQQHPNNAATTNTRQQQSQRLTRSRDHEDDDESSDVDLPTYALQFQLANVAGRNEPNSAAGVSGSGSAAVNDSPRGRHNAATAASTAGSGTATGATSGGSRSSPFNDWDSDTGTPRSSSGSVGGQANSSDEPYDATSTGASNNSGAKPSFFFGTSSFILRSRKEVAALINTECCRGGPTPDLDSIMETLFNSGTPIDNPDNIEWVRWLIAGGRTPKEFVKIGKCKIKVKRNPINCSNRVVVGESGKEYEQAGGRNNKVINF